MWFRKLVTNDRRAEDRESNDDDDNFSISDDEHRDDERGDGDNVNPPAAVRDQRRTTRRPVKLCDYITV